MTIQTFQPSERLAPFIRSYVVVESSDSQKSILLPDTSIVLAFRYKGKVDQYTDNRAASLPSSVLSGLRGSVRHLQYRGEAGNVIIQFKETGPAAFFREPLHELFGDSVAVGDIIGLQQVSLVEEQLLEATDNQERVQVLEGFLTGRLHDPAPDPLVLAAVEKIRQAKGVLRIRDLADSLFVSQDAFEKRFRKLIGSSAKQYASIIRLRAIIDKGRSSESLTAIAFEAGYFDQSHFNKDFRKFTGQSPTDFFNSRPLW